MLGRERSMEESDGLISLTLDTFLILVFLSFSYAFAYILPLCSFFFDLFAVPQMVALDIGTVREFSCLECFDGY